MRTGVGVQERLGVLFSHNLSGVTFGGLLFVFMHRVKKKK